MVERLQRIVRPEALSRLGIAIEEKIFEDAEVGHPFNRYIEALYDIREAVSAENEMLFYLELLKTPIKDRYPSLLQIGIRTGGAAGRHIMNTISTAHVILERRFL